MKKWNFAILAFAASAAFAAPETYSIKSDLTINGKFIATTQITTKENEPAEVSKNDENGKSYFLVVTPSEGQGEIKGRKAILMKFVVGIIENGQRKILGEPRIMAAENSKAEISINRPGSRGEQYNLSVTAERK